MHLIGFYIAVLAYAFLLLAARFFHTIRCVKELIGKRATESLVSARARTIRSALFGGTQMREKKQQTNEPTNPHTY